jgi:hypothetical protein
MNPNAVNTRNHMTSVRQYRTGLVAVSRPHPKDPKPPYKGKAWRATIERYKRDVMHTTGQEIIISAKSPETAQRALNLIMASHYLLEGDPPVWPIELIAYRDQDLVNLEETERHSVTAKFFSTVGLRLACSLAAKASFRRANVYAIFKYHFSVSLYSNFAVDLEPFSSHISVSPYPSDHIVFCHSIISAYSAIEELGLQVRASSEKPSKIKGEWNPPVKKDLEDRLQRAGIDLNETLLWTLRGPRRRIELIRPPRTLEREPWSIGSVRDAEVSVVDAIADVSWLRSFVASHKIKDVSAVLSPYDVANAQHLARRLILESMGFWGYYEKH